MQEIRRRERISARSRTNITNRENHLAKRYGKINKRCNQHNDLFYADIDALERVVNQYAQRHRHILPKYFGWELKFYFERPIGPFLQELNALMPERTLTG